jgi:hypothetical protein
MFLHSLGSLNNLSAGGPQGGMNATPTRDSAVIVSTNDDTAHDPNRLALSRNDPLLGTTGPDRGYGL